MLHFYLSCKEKLHVYVIKKTLKNAVPNRTQHQITFAFWEYRRTMCTCLQGIGITHANMCMYTYLYVYVCTTFLNKVSRVYQSTYCQTWKQDHSHNSCIMCCCLEWIHRRNECYLISTSSTLCIKTISCPRKNHHAK